MSTDQIRETIALAVAQEQRSGQLLLSFEQNLESLRSSLLLPSVEAPARLVSFVQRYIEYVPEFLDGIAGACREAQTYQYVAPFLHMAEDFFLLPPAELAQATGLQELMDESYLAQRLFEEINDRHIRYRSVALLPIDMTRSNIIIHHLIGDHIANRLNQLVEHAVGRLVDPESVLQQSQELAAEAMSWPELPCLSRDEQIDLRLPATGSY